MILRIKTLREEFDSAVSGGYVYGEIIRKKPFPVYADLGTEKPYEPSTNDDPNTEYRIFRNCSVYIAETEEKLDRGEYVSSTKDTTVILYC